MLASEVEEAFAGVQLDVFVDGTCGAGGHARIIAEHHPELSRLIALDKDASALKIAEGVLEAFRARLTFVQGDFADLEEILEQQGVPAISGIVLDLGVSSMQLDRADRGFSFRQDGPLDMRMDQTSELTAADIVNTWSQEELTALLREGGERFAGRCARVICERRRERPFERTLDLAELVRPVAYKRGKIHPATCLFQALRIAVNGELDGLESVLKQIVRCLKPGGRAAIISFHSLEDRRVKHFVKDRSKKVAYGEAFTPELIDVTRRPVVPSEEEMASNPRARSAKLRIFEKL